MKAAAVAPLPAWRRDEREPRTDISQVELQLHGLRDAPRRGLHQLRREDRGADPRVRSRRARRRAVLGRLPRGDRAVFLHPARALAGAAHAVSAATASAALAFLASRAEAPPALSTAMASSRATIKERVSLASRRPKRLVQLPPSRH